MIDCPTCGLTRSFISISHFQLERAYYFNRIGLLIYIIVVLQIPYRVFCIVNNLKFIADKRLKLSSISIYLVGFTLIANWLYNLIRGKII